MLLTRQGHQTTRFQLNMAAMIDVVFLLLIFFMCTSSFRQTEDELPAQLPRTHPATQAADDDFQPVRISVRSVGDGALVECDGQPCGTFDSLANLLKQRRQIADIPVIIQGQNTVPFSYMVAALDACHVADLTRVAFSVEQVTP